MSRKHHVFLSLVALSLINVLTALGGENLIVNGDFEEFEGGKSTGWKMSWGNSKIEKEEGNHFVVIEKKTKQAVPWIEQNVGLKSDWTHLKLSAKMRVTGLEQGDQAWQTATLTGRFLDENGERLTYINTIKVTEDTNGWVEREAVSEIPRGAVKVALQVAHFGKAGLAAFDDIRLEPVEPPEAAADRKKAALRMAQLKSEWMKSKSLPLSATRDRIVLDGTWAFRPTRQSADGRPSDDWGTTIVPGNWAESTIQPGNSRFWFDWHDRSGREYNLAWYRRDVKVPAEWAGRAVLLQIDRVSTDAKAYVDGKEVGRVAWPRGTVDLTDAVQPGQTVTLDLFVAAILDQKTLLQAMGDAPGQNFIKEAKLLTRGLTGSVTLISRPRGAHIADVFIQPSVRKEAISLQVELAGAAAGPIQLRAEMLDENGQVEKVFTHTVQGTDEEVQRFNVRWPWSSPRLWDIGQPNLYTLRLSAEGANLKDERADRFGFRELWIEGKHYYLNGRIFHARPATAGFNSGRNMSVREMIAEHQKFGYNLIEIWPNKPWRDRSSGDRQYEEDWFDLCDTMGIGITGIMPHPGWKGSDIRSPEAFRQMQVWAEDHRRHFGNHPSILMWGSSGNATGSELHPSNIGHSERAEQHYTELHDDAEETGRRLRKWLDKLHVIDPTRPIFFHNCGYLGDAFTTNFYLNVTPLQEREDWLSAYAEHGNMPMWYVEFGMPHQICMFRRRTHYSPNSEPWVTEFAAIYLGSRAFEIENKAYRNAMRAKLEEGQKYNNWHNNRDVEYSPMFQGLLDFYVPNTWRSWRTWEINGGMNPWTGDYFLPNGELSALGRGILPNNQDTLAWICGDAEGGHTDKTHHYRAGGTLRKRVAILNDTLAEQSYTASWTLVVNGKVISTDSAEGNVPVSGKLFVPIEFKLSASIDGAKVDAEIKLQAGIGKATHTDRFDFRIYAEAPKLTGTVLAGDSAGKTSSMLRHLGLTVATWNGQASDHLVVIGREHERFSDPVFAAQLEAHVRKGGKAIVFAQHPQILRDHFAFRVSHHQNRYVFPVDPTHPVAAGLDSRDLTNWSASTTMLEPHPNYGPDERSPSSGKPMWGWRWGNKHVVCSGAIEKTHRAGWTPILECDFDLAYSPLMQLDYGKGRVILVQLDLEDQYKRDPVAELLSGRIIRYAQESSPSPRVDTCYVGSRAGRDLLDQLGLRYRVAEALPSGPAPKLVVLGGDISIPEPALRGFVEQGNRVLVLAQDSAQAPFGVSLQRETGFTGAAAIDTRAPVVLGLSPSDTRYRNERETWLIRAGVDELLAGGLLGTKRLGEGLLVYSQLDPNRFDADTLTYFRFTRWRQTRALAQVLANLGGAFEQDARFFKPGPLKKEEDKLNRLNISLAGPWQIKALKRLKPAPSPNERYEDPGLSDQAKRLMTDAAPETDWEIATMPKMIEHIGPDWNFDGEIVLRRTFTVPKELLGRKAKISLGAIDDIDMTYVNGRLVGSVTEKGYATDRVYTIPADLLRPGENVVAIRVWDQFGGGGINTVPEKLWIGEAPFKKNATPVSPLYHPDYIPPEDDYAFSDDPHRYYNY